MSLWSLSKPTSRTAHACMASISLRWVDEEFGVKHVEGSLSHTIQLWDTAGQERFRKSMVQHYYRNVHAVVFVYDVTNAASFRSLPAWIEECKQHALGSEVPRILVGNKCDLLDSVQVGTDLAQQFADAHSMPLFETSAKSPNSPGDRKSLSSDHVEAIFMTVAHKLKSQKPLVLSQPPEGSGGTVTLNAGRNDGADGGSSWSCGSC
uniref:RAB33B, member RAS oncogene family a n=1 Tax=Cyprinodon variegatus TaxID=28743 RepID=A0A3Q2G7F9_CYPVA